MIKRIRKNTSPKDFHLEKSLYSPVEGYFLFAGDAKGHFVTPPVSVKSHKDPFFAVVLYVDSHCNGHVLDFPIPFKETRIERYANLPLRTFEPSFDWWKKHKEAFQNNRRMLFCFETAIIEITRHSREYISFPKIQLEERYIIAHTHQNMIVTVYFNSRYIKEHNSLRNFRFGEKIGFSQILGKIR